MICFAWSGFPQYAARCVRGFAEVSREPVVVVATRPQVPIEGMDELCGCQIHWIARDEGRHLQELVGCIPKCMFVSGWSIPAFNRFRDEVCANGGTVVAMCDGNWTLSPFTPLSLRWWQSFSVECAKAVRFRLFLRHKYNAFFVPGKSGVSLLRFYGARRGRLATGMYAADSSLFFDGKPLSERPKSIIYVGQFIARKNVLRLAEAFLEANIGRDWRLDMYGSGPLRGELETLADGKEGFGLQIHDFVQPEDLAAKYREARIFCLPSLVEHWGVVAHEAALSGCILLLGNKVGATADFLGHANGRDFNPYDMKAIIKALKWAMNLSDGELAMAQAESLRLAAESGIRQFAAGAMHAMESAGGGVEGHA